MSVLDCLLENLPLTLAALGLVLLGFVIAAVIVVIEAGTAGAGTGFAAAVAAVLGSWWISITGSVLVTLAVAYQLCVSQSNTPEVQVTAGAAIGATAALTAIFTNRWTTRYKQIIR